MQTDRSYSLAEGLIAGLIGYLAVVVVIAILDLAMGRGLFFTPGMLGRGLVAEPAPGSEVGANAVLAYNGMHLLVFLLIGTGVVQLAHFVELHPMAWFLAFFVLVFGFFVAETTLLLLDPEREVLSWWSVFLATGLAAFAMGVFINARHPGLRERIEDLET